MVEDRSADLQLLLFAEESLLTENEEEEIGEEKTCQLQQRSRKKPVFAKKHKRGLNNNDEMLQKAVSDVGTASEHILKEEKKGNLIRKKYFPVILQMSYGKYQMDVVYVWQGTK